MKLLNEIQHKKAINMFNTQSKNILSLITAKIKDLTSKLNSLATDSDFLQLRVSVVKDKMKTLKSVMFTLLLFQIKKPFEKPTTRLLPL